MTALKISIRCAFLAIAVALVGPRLTGQPFGTNRTMLLIVIALSAIAIYSMISFLLKTLDQYLEKRRHPENQPPQIEITGDYLKVNADNQCINRDFECESCARRSCINGEYGPGRYCHL